MEIDSRNVCDMISADKMTDMEYGIIRSKRKTVSLEVKIDGSVLVRAPIRMKNAEIERFVASKAKWIEKHMKNIHCRQAEMSPDFTDKEIAEFAHLAKEDIPERVAYFAESLNVTVGRITIRNQKTRWGSCSSKGNLNFNCLLMLCPAEVRDYVVVHELCHLIQMNHSPRFWAKVESILPDYKSRREWLKKEGSDIIARLDR